MELSFDICCVKVHGGILTVGEMYPKKQPSKQVSVQGRAHMEMKFCRLVGVPSVITYANLGDVCLNSIGWWGVWFYHRLSSSFLQQSCTAMQLCNH